jgi:hypothetical protein
MVSQSSRLITCLEFPGEAIGDLRGQGIDSRRRTAALDFDDQHPAEAVGEKLFYARCGLGDLGLQAGGGAHLFQGEPVRLGRLATRRFVTAIVEHQQPASRRSVSPQGHQASQVHQQ